MKGKWLLVVSVLVAVLGATGCATAKVYDKTVPLEKSSTLEIGNGFVKSFNGEKTLWDGTVIIPAGTHTLVIHNSETSAYATSVEYGEVSMTHTFLPGHTYVVFAPIQYGKINGRIIDKEIFSKDLVPDPTSPDASLIEGKWQITDGKNTNEFIFAKDEYARFVNGNYYSRGFIEINKNSVSMTVAAFYIPKKQTWSVIKIIMSGGNLTYNGTSWFLGKFELQKVE